MAVVALRLNMRGAIKDLPRRYRTALRAAVAEQGKENLEKAQELSRHRYYSLKELRDMGHPYGRRKGRVQMRRTLGGVFTRPWIINYQSGKFYNSWKHALSYYGYISTVSNSAPHAKWLRKGGTSKMIGRNIWGYVARTHQKSFRSRVERHIREAAGVK